MEEHQQHGHRNLDEWIRRLTSRDMPIFSQTAKRISVISAMTQSHAAELANAILQDALLTTRVLKMANSVYYMGGRKGLGGKTGSVSTVTRAVMILGFDTIRTICQTKAVVEDLLRGFQRERLSQKMACSFHAASQARWLASQAREESPEEIFIAALLLLLGEMTFWCFADETLIGELEKKWAETAAAPERAVQEVLGFDFNQLTLALNKEWHLGPLMLEALESGRSGSSRVKKIFWGHQLAQAAQKGWNSPEVSRLIDQVTDALGLPRETVVQMVQENAREAIQTAISYGAAQAGRMIPLPGGASPSDRHPEPAEENGRDDDENGFRSNPALQLKILHDLSGLMLEKKPDYGVFISLVLEGIYRAVGLDRVLFSLLTPDRSRLEVKFQLGWQENDPSPAFPSKPIPVNDHFLGGVLEQKQPLWIKDLSEPRTWGGDNSGQNPPIGEPPFFVMPIVVHGKSIGLIYADRRRSGRELDEESFQGFQHFCRQAAIGLSVITNKEP